jgi:hypothetical protein
MMKEEHTAVPNGDEAEKLSFYPRSENDSYAIVSIGHIDFRTSFHFDNDFDAYLCFKALKKVVEMNIN